VCVGREDDRVLCDIVTFIAENRMNEVVIRGITSRLPSNNACVRANDTRGPEIEEEIQALAHDDCSRPCDHIVNTHPVNCHM